jgi:class 3 adenylate cyclase/predicted ATPase
MTCSACGAANRAGRKFCAECGAPLAVLCAACGAANEPGERFCGECGAPLAAEAAPAAPAAERRLVSVLFADLVGFTPASEHRDTEEVRELLARYFDEASRVVERFGGVIEKFIGDAVMAVWGAPVAQEDDAERAVRAALDIVAAVAAIGPEVGIPDLRARAAVVTGEAAVTVGATNQGMVAGDVVNTAARLQSLAEPGAVLVGDGTHRASKAAVAYEDAGAHVVKGKDEPVHAWRATHVVAARGGGLRSSGLEAPFVGREAELRLVKELFHAAAGEQRARLVSVVGVAGIGKSRLAWELEKYLDGLVDNIYWHRGRCISYGEGVAYWALGEMIRMRARIAEGDPHDEVRAKLHAAVEEYVADADERAWIEPRLGHLLGVGDAGVSGREDLFAAWRMFFERLAGLAPVVLVFEDIHWADDALLDFIEYLLEWSRPYPIFVMTLGRPELEERHPAYGAARRNFTSIFLEPLAPEAIDALLEGLVPGLPAPVRERVRERSEGIPLYAVETVRMLLDRGLVERDGDGYRPTRAIEALEVPETLQALIAARLDGLAADERRLVADASILGKTFTVEGLLALTASERDDVVRLLTALVRKEVFSLQADPRSPERGQYGFVQALVQKVAHGTLSRRERKARHLAAAAFFEGLRDDGETELIEVVAAHYVDAYNADPDADDAPVIKARARERLAQAGERAESLAANSDAQRYFDQAAALADDALAAAALYERAGKTAVADGRFDDAIERLERAQRLFDEHGRPHTAARVAALLGRALWHSGQGQTALTELERAFAVLAADEPDEDVGALAAEIARLQFFAGHIEEAATWVERALAVAELVAAPDLLSQALNTKHLVLVVTSHPEEAVALLRHSLAIAQENGLTSSAFRAYFNLANQLAITDRVEEALAMDKEALAIANRLGQRNEQAMFLHHIVHDLYALGRWDEADGAFDELQAIAATHLLGRWSLDWFPKPLVDLRRGELGAMPAPVYPEADSDRQVRAGDLVGRAAYLLAAGDPRSALEAASEAWRSRDVLGMHVFVKDAFALAIEAAHAGGDDAALEQLVADIAELAPGLTPPYLRAQSARCAALLAARRGEAESVEASTAAAVAALDRLAWRFDAAAVRLEHAEWLLSAGETERAVAAAAAAAEAFTQLRAAPWLERAQRIAAQRIAPVRQPS